MEHEPDLAGRVREALERTGHPHELGVGNVLRSRDWGVQHSSYYIDKDEEKGREIDVDAIDVVDLESPKGGDKQRPWLVYRLLAECKKSEKPWVVMTSETEYRLGWETHLDPKGNPLLRNRLNAMRDRYQPMQEAYQNVDQPRIGRLVVELANLGEASRRDTQERGRDSAYEALLSVVKATHHIQSTYEGDVEDVRLYFPVVVLKGRLFEAWYEGDGLRVEERDRMSVEFGYLSPSYDEAHVPIDVVTTRGLPDLLDKKIEPFRTLLPNLIRRDLGIQ